LQFLLLYVASALGLPFLLGPLHGGAFRRFRVAYVHGGGRRGYVGAQIVPELFILDVANRNDEASGVVEGKRRDGLSGAGEGEAAEQNSGGSFDGSVRSWSRNLLEPTKHRLSFVSQTRRRAVVLCHAPL